MISIISLDYEMPGESIGIQFAALDSMTLELVGICTVVLYSDETVPQLQRLFVKNERRHHGIADRLMTRAEDLCRSRGWKVLDLDVHPSNGGMGRFYVSRGYEPWGRTDAGGLRLRKQIS